MPQESDERKTEDQAELFDAFLSVAQRTTPPDPTKLLRTDQSTRRMQNLCQGCRFKEWYLDIDGTPEQEHPKVILNPDGNARGAFWKVTILFTHPWPPAQMCTIQNLATPYRNWYLDIDGNTAEVYLSEERGSGTEWQLIWNEPIFGMRSLVAQSRGLPHWLDINGNTGEVILETTSGAGSGATWQWRYE